MATMTDERPKQRRRGRDPRQFRPDAAARARPAQTVADVAASSVSSSTFGNCFRQERIDQGEPEGTTSEDRERIAELERQVQRLTAERDPRKRSVAFWAKVSDR